MLPFLQRARRCPPFWSLWRRCASEKTTVMSFGDGSQCAVGLPPGLDAYEPTPIASLPPDVCSIGVGHYHSLAVTSSGQVWEWGRNSEFQLGRRLPSARHTWSEPQRVEGLDHVSVHSAYASGVISAIIGEDGSLWVWGKSKRGQLGLGKDVFESVAPVRVKKLAGEVIVKAAFGWGHALALSDSGKLFGWGYYADGRIGDVLGKGFVVSPLESVSAATDELDMPIIWEPALIEEVKNIQVVDISCGLDHSLVLCRDGTLLSGGSNVYGQLGRSKGSIESGLHPVDLPSFQPVKIASGLGHSLALCHPRPSEASNDAGSSIVSWGWNDSFQLGRRGKESAPSVIDSLAGKNPVMISGGRVHSVAVTANRDVWTWGCGKNGRLGLGSSTDEPDPMPVECLDGFEVLQAEAGFDHTLVLVVGNC
ncbi:hypothetical protein M569_03294 [Genlisea aurea]|uniref:RCC1-like domain-containing protein n=1 Tax=Genlisea aurea TaxID=192259 RepID=S8E6K7_9LAMI|nr:hypothetical protein M569_03294 [Genlisea aurea]